MCVVCVCACVHVRVWCVCACVRVCLQGSVKKCDNCSGTGVQVHEAQYGLGWVVSSLCVCTYQ